MVKDWFRGWNKKCDACLTLSRPGVSSSEGDGRSKDSDPPFHDSESVDSYDKRLNDAPKDVISSFATGNVIWRGNWVMILETVAILDRTSWISTKLEKATKIDQRGVKTNRTLDSDIKTLWLQFTVSIDISIRRE